MANEHKCEHELCKCRVLEHDGFCSTACESASPAEEMCGCYHNKCHKFGGMGGDDVHTVREGNAAQQGVLAS